MLHLWLARMIEGGADPIFIARRLCILAPKTWPRRPQQWAGCRRSRYCSPDRFRPEGCSVVASEIYLARAPKSNAVKNAYTQRWSMPKGRREYPCPLHLRNAATPLMKQIGYGKEYRYVHSDPAAKEEMECLPEQLRGHKYFFEEQIKGEEIESDDQHKV